MIITKTNQAEIESSAAADLVFTAPDTITTATLDLSVLTSGDVIRVEGSTSNDGQYVVDTAVALTVTLIEQTLSSEDGLPNTNIIEGIVNPPTVVSVLGAGSVAIPTSTNTKAAVAISIPSSMTTEAPIPIPVIT